MFIFFIILLLKTAVCVHIKQNYVYNFDYVRRITKQNFKCSSTANGYKCTGTYFVNKQLCNIYQNICPNDWGCIELSRGFLCRPHDVDSFGLQHQPKRHQSGERQKRDSVDLCSDLLCQNGALCKNGECKCLKHYKGKYCNIGINYCTNNPCKHHAECIPRVGDFTCRCGPNLGGKFCQTPVEHILHNMRNPNFLYEPLQYAGFSYYYVFHTEHLGFQPDAEVDFGDGTIVKRKYLSINLNNAFGTLIKFFSPPLNIESNQLEVYAFKHTYKVPNIYTIKVRAWNKYHEVYNTDYEVQVIAAGDCSLEVTLHNAALTKDSALNLYRQNSINLMSTAWSNCMQIKLEYQWRIHHVKSFDDGVTSENLYYIEGNNVDLHKSNLEIPPYTLDYGRYIVALYINMVKPKQGIQQKVFTWFTINQMPIVAHIQGGVKLWVHIKSVFYLDASLSYDPNYGKKRQPSLTFSWMCRPRNEFCKGFDVLNATGPILIVPAGVLQLQTYTFEVWVNNNSFNSTEATNYTGTAIQMVQGIDVVVPYYSIMCLRNCIGGRANNMYTIALRGMPFLPLKEEMETKKNWMVYPIKKDDDLKETMMFLDNTDFGEDNLLIILYEQQLEPATKFKFVFSGYNAKTSMLGKRNTTFAEFFLTTHSSPFSGMCSTYPTEGYGMLTTFSVSCSDFSDSEDLTIWYEITQFVDLDNREATGAFVGFDFTSNIINITLSPGYRKHDYQTMLKITVTNNYGMSTFIECPVTVFPLIYYLKNPDDVMLRFVHVGTGLASPLSILLSGGNHFELVQQIISTCFTIEQFLQSEDSLYVDKKFSDLSVEQIRDILINYLYQAPITNVLSIKHVATALDKVMNLPSKSNIWKINIVIGIDIMRNLIQKLEDRFNVYDEMVFQYDMDDIGILLINIASSILKTPTANYQVLQEDNAQSENDPLIRKRHMQSINPFNINKNILANHDSTNALEVIDRFMRLYMTYKLPNERTTLFTSSKLSLLMKKAAPEHLTIKSLSLTNRVSPKLIFDRSLFHKNAFCNLEMIIMDDNPNWYEDKNSAALHFPFIKMNLTNEDDDSPVDADLEVDFRPVQPLQMELINASAPVRLFWQIEEKHIQVHRIIVPKGGKLLINFMPLESNYKLRVVIKKEMRPRMSDFWYNAITIPQHVLEKSRDKGLSVFVDDEGTEEKTFYYLGVLPHIDTLKLLMRHVEEPILPHAFHYDDEMNYEKDMHEYYDVTENLEKAEEDEDADNVKYIKHRKSEPKTADNNQTLPYAFFAHSVRCLTWNETAKQWKSNCNVRASTSSSRVICNCSGYNPLTANFQKVSVKYQKHTKFRYWIKYTDNLLIPFMAVFTLILFIGLFRWAAAEDREDRLRRTVCFLVDNYPQCEYCYLIIVHTGRKIKAGTTSNVTIELEGTHSTSMPHVLKDWTRDVMNHGSQDWFVLKTMKPLGEIYCLHIWTDYSGARPSWYCSKIIVHDIQEQQVWFFIVEKWFDPINGDGSMSYTIYQSTDEKIFATSYQLKENVAREFDSGMHGWFSIFYKHPYSNYTRKQRVGVAYAHLVLIMMILILLNDLPVADSPKHQIHKDGVYKWEVRDFLMAVYAILIAFPIHSLLLWLFRCIKPSSQWTDSRLDRTLSRFNMKHEISEDVMWIDPEDRSLKGKIQVTSRPKKVAKQVSFYNDFYEPEGERQLRSIYSLQKLEKEAGNDKVVPLRSPTSKVETEASRDEYVDTSDITSSIYGQEVVAQSYCFPPYFVYVAWILLVFITVPCVYVTVLYGVSYGWVMSLHYLTSFFWAIILSIVVLEPFKLLFCAVYLFFYNRREYAIEDRSDLVMALNPEFKVPSYLRAHVIDKINKLRESPMYMPLTEEKMHKLMRNRVVSFLTRMIIADFMLLILFVLLLFTIIYDIYGSYNHLHYKDVMELLGGASRKSSMTDVSTAEDLIYYLNNTVIAHLQHYGDAGRYFSQISLNPVVDEVNYLVGVIRLRQIRKLPSACRARAVMKWAARCVRVFDKNNYTEGWAITNGLDQRDYSMLKQPWLYTKPEQRFHGVYINHNETRYPPGSYQATLGRTKKDSMMKLEYLAKNNWFNYLTTVVYTDFVLFNPHKKFLTMVTLMAERTEQGVYYVYDDIEIVKMRPMETSGQLLVLLIMLGLFICLMLYVHKESRKYSLLQPKQVFTKKWDRLKKLLLVLGTISFAIYTNKSINFDNYNAQISRASNEKYIDFGVIAFWDDCLLIFISLMLFFVILELCVICKTSYKVNLACTVISKSRGAAVAFFIFLALLIVCFTWAAFALFGRSSYDFQSFGEGLLTISACSFRNFTAGQFGNYEIFFIMILYYLALIIALFFIFRWLMAAIIIHTYSAVKGNARFGLYQPILSGYTKKYFDSIDSSPNRKPLKLTVYLRNTEPRMRAIGFLFVDFYSRKKSKRESRTREKAMDAIAYGVISRKNKYQKGTADTVMEKYQRKEQAKALARSIIITNTLKNKLEYLGVKIDRMIREERYRKMVFKKV